jgi:hypothetical protein
VCGLAERLGLFPCRLTRWQLKLRWSGTGRPTCIRAALDARFPPLVRLFPRPSGISSLQVACAFYLQSYGRSKPLRSVVGRRGNERTNFGLGTKREGHLVQPELKAITDQPGIAKNECRHGANLVCGEAGGIDLSVRRIESDVVRRCSSGRGGSPAEASGLKAVNTVDAPDYASAAADRGHTIGISAF